MPPYFGLPFEEDVAEGFLARLRIRRRRHLVDEHVAYARIEHAALDPALSEDQDRQTQPEENAGLQVVPRRGDAHWSILLLLFGRPRLANAGQAAVLLEAKDHASRTVARDQHDLSQRKFRRVVRASERTRLEVEPLELAQNQRPRCLLSLAEARRAGDEDGNIHPVFALGQA